jgi:hypothetical protein
VTAFDIFLGSDGTDALWLECIDGLDAATARMNEIAGKQPGTYFILNLHDGQVVAKVDTRTHPEQK